MPVWVPAYRPACNPVERLGEDVQSRIAVLEVWMRSRLTMLQAPVAGSVRRSTPEAMASLTGYASLVEAMRAR